MPWTSICPVDDLPDDEGLRIEVGGKVLAAFKVEHEYFVTDDACPHGESSLAEGYVEPDCSVECIAHMARFSLRTGEVLAPPATSPLRTYETKVDGDELVVLLDD
jgi:3-phenylpropionate/trans-cinnamate dioxygenase ferredoxin subunit